MPKSWDCVMKQQDNKINRVDRHVGTRLAQLRIAAGLSQAQLSYIGSVSYQQIQKYESGRNRISASKLYVFARYFDVSVDSFYPEGQAEAKDDPRLLRVKNMFAGIDEKHLPAIEAFACLIKKVK